MEASGQDSKGLAGLGAVARRNLGSAAAKAAGLARRAGAGGRSLEIATIAAMVGTLLMAVTEFMDLYRIIGLDGHTLGTVSAGSNHGYALLVIGPVALGGLLLSRWTGQWLPAAAAAGLSLIALIVVLAGDLPDTSTSGLTRSRRVGDAEATTGMWVELLAALLALGGTTAVALLLRRQGDGDRP